MCLCYDNYDTYHIRSGFAVLYWTDFSFTSGPRRPIVSYNAMLRPFQLDVWLAFMASIGLVCLVTLIFHKKAKICSTGATKSKSFGEKVMSILAISVEEPVERINHQVSNSTLVLLGFFLLTSLVISRTYKGSILASLVSVELEMKINTAEVRVIDCYHSEK